MSGSVVMVAAGGYALLCPGAQLEVTGQFSGVTQFGQSLEEGDLFTVDAEENFIEVSRV